jgi:hypothetical protein
MAAGYSGTPLPKKLGIKEGSAVRLDGEVPERFVEDTLGPLPPRVSFKGRLQGSLDVVVFFTTSRRAFEGRIEALARAVFPAGGCWIAWPKRASKVPTDMTEDVVRAVALPLGLVDNKVCAIDGTWSGLRVVWRKELRRGTVPVRA